MAAQPGGDGPCSADARGAGGARFDRVTAERRIAGRGRAGLTLTFAPGEQEPVEKAIAELRALSVAQLRVPFGWNEIATDWPRSLLERLARELEPIPVLDAPRTPDQLPGFLEAVRRLATAAGSHFAWIEVRQDHSALEPDEDVLARAVASAAALGKKIALGGIDPRRTRFLEALAARAVFAQARAVVARSAE